MTDDDKKQFENHIIQISIPATMVAYIICGGVGTRDVFDPCIHHGNSYEVVNYGIDSFKWDVLCVFDIVSVIRDIMSMNEFESSNDPHGNNYEAIRSRPKRIRMIVDKIKAKLLDDDYPTVVLIGFSHGALILHGAILRLMCCIDVTSVHLNKIRFYTVGAPRYPSPLLLKAYESESETHLYNVYHQNDQMLNKGKLIRTMLQMCHAKNPFQTPIQMTNYNDNIQFNLTERLICHTLFTLELNDNYYHIHSYNLVFFVFKTTDYTINDFLNNFVKVEENGQRYINKKVNVLYELWFINASLDECINTFPLAKRRILKMRDIYS